jgi:hypothetical protein
MGAVAEAVLACVFSVGLGKTRSIWHLAAGADELIQKPNLEFADYRHLVVPTNKAGQPIMVMLPDGTEAHAPMVSLETPYTKRVDEDGNVTWEPCVGMTVIEGADLVGRLGQAGGQYKTNWTPMQPIDGIRDVIEPLIESIGLNLEGVFWLDQRLIIEAKMADVDGLDWAEDHHDVRIAFVFDYSGAGKDKIVISLTRSVCANTIAVAEIEANAKGSIWSTSHHAGIRDAWKIDGKAFGEAAANATSEYFSLVKAANGVRVTTDAQRAKVMAVVMGPAPMVDPVSGHHLNADGTVKLTDGKATNGRGALTSYDRKMDAYRRKVAEEQENARKVGIDPNSLRVYWEAYTNLWQHDGQAALTKGNKTEDAPYALRSSQSPMGKALAVAGIASGSRLTTDPLTALLAEAGLMAVDADGNPLLNFNGADLTLEAAGLSPWNAEEAPQPLGSTAGADVLDSMLAGL